MRVLNKTIHIDAVNANKDKKTSTLESNSAESGNSIPKMNSGKIKINNPNSCDNENREVIAIENPTYFDHIKSEKVLEVETDVKKVLMDKDNVNEIANNDGIELKCIVNTEASNGNGMVSNEQGSNSTGTMIDRKINERNDCLDAVENTTQIESSSISKRDNGLNNAIIFGNLVTKSSGIGSKSDCGSNVETNGTSKKNKRWSLMNVSRESNLTKEKKNSQGSIDVATLNANRKSSSNSLMSNNGVQNGEASTSQNISKLLSGLAINFKKNKRLSSSLSIGSDTNNSNKNSPGNSNRSSTVDPDFIKQRIMLQSYFRMVMERKVYKKAVKKQHIVKELLETEQTYVKTLRNLFQYYHKPLKNGLKDTKEYITPIINAEECERLFFKADEIMDVHKELLITIEERVANWSVYQVIGDLFLNLAQSHLAVYSAYINNFDHATMTLMEIRDRPPFQKFIQDRRQLYKVKEDLHDLIIAPIQRIPRYSLLLEQIRKCTPKNHQDYPVLLEAEKHITYLNTTMNDRKQAKQMVTELESKVLDYPGKLSISLRYLVKENEVSEHVKTKGRKRRIFLCNDLILCTSLPISHGLMFSHSKTKPSRDKLNKTATKSTSDNNKYKFKWAVPLNKTEIRNQKYAMPDKKGSIGTRKSMKHYRNKSFASSSSFKANKSSNCNISSTSEIFNSVESGKPMGGSLNESPKCSPQNSPAQTVRSASSSVLLGDTHHCSVSITSWGEDNSFERHEITFRSEIEKIEWMEEISKLKAEEKNAQRAANKRKNKRQGLEQGYSTPSINLSPSVSKDNVLMSSSSGNILTLRKKSHYCSVPDFQSQTESAENKEEELENMRCQISLLEKDVEVELNCLKGYESMRKIFEEKISNGIKLDKQEKKRDQAIQKNIEMSTEKLDKLQTKLRIYEVTYSTQSFTLNSKNNI